MNASGVATSSSSTLAQMPSASRKVSRPDSFDMPAPVRMTMRSGRCMFLRPDQMGMSDTKNSHHPQDRLRDGSSKDNDIDKQCEDDGVEDEVSKTPIAVGQHRPP